MTLYSFKNFNFSHLEPFSVLYQNQDLKINCKIRIEFGFHCFTDSVCYYKGNTKIYKENISVDDIISIGNESRVFDILRYKQSLYLPALIKELLTFDDNSCFNTGKSNKGKTIYFTNRKIQHENKDYDYYIFFNSNKQKNNNILLFITSAYPREDNYYKQFKKSKIKLYTVIKKTLA